MTASGCVLVIDAGSSRLRCVLIDEEARVVRAEQAPWTYLDEPDAPEFARAFDPDALWRSLRGLISATLRDGGDVSAVSVTSQRQGVVFLDGEEREVYAGPNLDLRAVFEGAAIDEEMASRVYGATGRLPSFLLAPAKLLWFRDHRPETYDGIRRVLSLADWIAWRLTGTAACETTLAAEAGLLDIGSRTWCTSLLDSLSLSLDQPPLLQAGGRVGRTSGELAGATGLPEGTPVVAAGADSQCGLLGMGVSTRHDVGIVAGWSAPVQMVTPSPLLSPERRTWAGCFLDGESWVMESTAGDIGNGYRWLAETLFGEADTAYDAMDGLAAVVPVGAEGGAAVLGPARMDMAAPGMSTGGLLFPVPMTYGGAGRGHVVRAAIEAMAYTLRANVEQIEGLSGVGVPAVAVGGGMTRSRTFLRILTDVLGRPVRIAPMPETTAVGASLCARTSLGAFASLREAAASARPAMTVSEPDPRRAVEYDDLYERWLDLANRMKEFSL